MKVLITGSNGFVGTSLREKFLLTGVEVISLHRDRSRENVDKLDRVCLDLENLSEDDSFLEGVDVVVHLAARAHIMRDKSINPLSEYRRLNRDITKRLANLSAKHKVKRFIYLSSVKVNGEFTSSMERFSEKIAQPPTDDYGLSKYEAECELMKISRKTDMEVVIIRPPLVYGPNVKANFALMVDLVKKGMPIPLGNIQNKRSMVAMDNLVDFILLCSDREKSPRASNETFLISDGEDISTSSLLQKIAQAYGVKSRLFSVPTPLIKFGARLLGKRAVFDRLFGNLQINNSKARDLLGWKPVVTMDEQLKKMAKYDMDRGGK